jgi:ABC-2 type transport system ATP-binding protein
MGKTILISSHILHELAQLCTRIGIIEAGQLVTAGSLEEIYANLGLMQVVHTQILNLTDELVDKIRRIPGVNDVETQVDRVSIRLLAGELTPEDLHDAIHNLGARIRMYQPEAMDMETAFMKLTEGKIA